MAYRKIEFYKGKVINFITAATCLCIILICLFCLPIDPLIVKETCIRFTMPESAQKACDKYNGSGFSFIWPADYYGHLNLVIGKDKKIYYHTLFRPLDENPCHHLNPDSTQINISHKDFKKCALNELKSVIKLEQGRHPIGESFIITFSFIEGSKWQDFISALDLMDECGVKVYCLRDLTSTEQSSVKKLVTSGL